MSALKYLIVASCIGLAPLILPYAASAAPLPADLTRFTTDRSGNWASFTGRNVPYFNARTPRAFQSPTSSQSAALRSTSPVATKPQAYGAFAFTQKTSVAKTAWTTGTPKLLLTNWARNTGNQTTSLYRSSSTPIVRRYAFNTVYRGALTPVITNDIFMSSYARHMIPQAPGLYAQTRSGLEYSSITVQRLAAGAIPNPLPGALPLMASAIIGLGYVRFKSKKKRP